MSSSHREFDKIIQPVRSHINAFQKAFLKEFESIRAIYKLDFNTLHFVKGKHIRPILFFLSQGLVGKPGNHSADIAVMLELVHTASLIHDDVIDESSRRRGQQTLNTVLGNHFSVLMGDYLIARMMMISSALEYGEMTCLSEAILNMTHSELRQAICVRKGRMDEKDYFSIIEGKTGALFQAATGLAGHITHASDKQMRQLSLFGLQFGLAFQIKDDILDFSGSAAEMGKPVHQDLLKGRWTLPLIKTFQSLPQKDQTGFLELMDRDEIQWNLLNQIIEDQQGIQKAQSCLDDYSSRARETLSFFPESEYHSALLQLIQYNRDRHS